MMCGLRTKFFRLLVEGVCGCLYSELLSFLDPATARTLLLVHCQEGGFGLLEWSDEVKVLNLSFYQSIDQSFITNTEPAGRVGWRA